MRKTAIILLCLLATSTVAGLQPINALILEEQLKLAKEKIAAVQKITKPGSTSQQSDISKTANRNCSISDFGFNIDFPKGWVVSGGCMPSGTVDLILFPPTYNDTKLAYSSLILGQFGKPPENKSPPFTDASEIPSGYVLLYGQPAGFSMQQVASGCKGTVKNIWINGIKGIESLQRCSSFENEMKSVVIFNKNVWIWFEFSGYQFDKYVGDFDNMVRSFKGTGQGYSAESSALPISPLPQRTPSTTGSTNNEELRKLIGNFGDALAQILDVNLREETSYYDEKISLYMKGNLAKEEMLQISDEHIKNLESIIQKYDALTSPEGFEPVLQLFKQSAQSRLESDKMFREWVETGNNMTKERSDQMLQKSVDLEMQGLSLFNDLRNRIPSQSATTLPPSQVPPSEPNEYSQFIGDWKNSDIFTDGIVKAVVRGDSKGPIIHLFGSCHPTYCDWGEINANYSTGEIHGRYIFGFETNDVVLSLTPDNRLKIVDFTHFTDESGRKDYTSTDYFVKETQQLGPVTTSTALSSIVSIDYPNATTTNANGINDAGQIVGEYADSSDHYHGFLLSSGTYASIDYPNAPDTEAHGINNAGQIVGRYDDSSGTHGFLLSSGTYASIDYPNAVMTVADGINDAGQIVGWYSDSSSRHHGFLLTSGTYTTTDPLNVFSTEADGINNAGQIVGEYTDSSDHYHGFLLSSGTYDPIDPPNVLRPFANGINDAGQIVGEYSDSSDHYHGFLLSSGTYTPIDYPNSHWTIARGINNAGHIVGYYWDSSGHWHGFLLSSTKPSAIGSQALHIWHFDESGGKALDSGSDKVTWVPLGTALRTSGKFSNAAQFDGTGNTIYRTEKTTDLVFQSTDDITLSLWIKPNDVGRAQYLFATDDVNYHTFATIYFFLESKEQGKGPKNFVYFDWVNPVLVGSPSDEIVRSSKPIPFGEWTHIAVVKEGATKLKLYINGVLDNVANVSMTGKITDGCQKWLGAIKEGVASCGSNGVFYFSGLIDDFMIHKRILSDQEIQTLFTNITKLPSIQQNPALQNVENNLVIESKVTNALTGMDFVTDPSASNLIIVSVKDSKGEDTSSASVILKTKLLKVNYEYPFSEISPGVYQLSQRQILGPISWNVFGSFVGSSDVTVEVSKDGVKQYTSFELKIRDSKYKFEIPPKGWFLDKDHEIQVTVGKQQLTAYRIISGSGEMPFFVVMDESGKVVDEITRKKASEAAEAAHILKLDPDLAFIKEVSKTDKLVVTSSNLLDVALAVRDSSAKALGAIGIGVVTGGTSTPATISEASKMAFEAIAKELVKAAAEYPSEILGDPEKMTRKVYEQLLLDDSNSLDYATMIYQNQIGKPWDYSNADTFYKSYKSGFEGSILHANVIISLYPSTDAKSQIVDVMNAISEGAFGKGITGNTLEEKVAAQLEASQNIKDVIDEAAKKTIIANEFFKQTEDRWGPAPENLQEYLRNPFLSSSPSFTPSNQNNSATTSSQQTQPSYQVIFTESGLQKSCWLWIFGCSLPNWSITLDDNTQFSTSTSITFKNVNTGRHYYSPNAAGYSVSSSAIPLQVNGDVNQVVNFVKNP